MNQIKVLIEISNGKIITAATNTVGVQVVIANLDDKTFNNDTIETLLDSRVLNAHIYDSSERIEALKASLI